MTVHKIALNHEADPFPVVLPPPGDIHPMVTHWLVEAALQWVSGCHCDACGADYAHHILEILQKGAPSDHDCF
jgi:hypothetical protein